MVRGQAQGRAVLSRPGPCQRGVSRLWRTQSRPDPTRRYPRPDPTSRPAGRRARLVVPPVRRSQEEWSPVARRHGRPHPCCFPSPGPVWTSEQQTTQAPALSTGIIGCIPGATVRSGPDRGGAKEGGTEGGMKTRPHTTEPIRAADRQIGKNPGLRLAPGVDGGPAESTAGRLRQAAAG